MTRRGSSLLELLVALPIAALLAAAAAAALIASWRLVRAGNASMGSAHEFRHAQSVLEADVRPLHAADLREIRDTVIEFDAMMGVGLICAVTTTGRVDLISVDPLDDRGISWASSVQGGDLVHAWSRDSTARYSLTAQRTTLVDASWGSSCAAAPWTSGWSDVRIVRLTLSNAIASMLVVGSALTIKRRTRVSLYRSGTEWFLGRRTHNGVSWDVIQPVAGPFRSPAIGGMTVRMLDHSGTPTANTLLAAAVRISLQSTRRPVGNAPAKVDSATFDIVLRGESAQRGG